MTKALWTLMLVLLSVAPAYAECAWVLWGRLLSQSEGTGWVPGRAFTTPAECDEALRKYLQEVAEKKATPAVLACYPDTVDPRGPKSK